VIRLTWQKINNIIELLLIPLILTLLWWTNYSNHSDQTVEIVRWSFILIFVLSFINASLFYLTNKSKINLIKPIMLFLVIISFIFNLFNVMMTIFFYCLFGATIYGAYKLFKAVKEKD